MWEAEEGEVWLSRVISQAEKGLKELEEGLTKLEKVYNI